MERIFIGTYLPPSLSWWRVLCYIHMYVHIYVYRFVCWCARVHSEGALISSLWYWVRDIIVSINLPLLQQQCSTVCCCYCFVCAFFYTPVKLISWSICIFTYCCGHVASLIKVVRKRAATNKNELAQLLAVAVNRLRINIPMLLLALNNCRKWCEKIYLKY